MAMKEMNVNGHIVKTNYNGYTFAYPFSDGNDKKTMRMELRNSCMEQADEMLARLAEKGYKRITFYNTTTRIRGIYGLIAFCK